MRKVEMLSGAAALALFLLVGQMDYQDELDQERIYCDFVEDGTWRAYREDINCSKTGETKHGNN